MKPFDESFLEDMYSIILSKIWYMLLSHLLYHSLQKYFHRMMYGKVIKIFWQKGINIECVQPYLNRNTSATLQLDVDISSFHWAHIGLLPPHVPNHVFHCLAYWAHIILMLANIGYIQHVFNNYGNGSKWSCFLHLFYLQYQG